MRNQKGQTSVEYILLLAVVMAVLSNLLPRIQEYLISNPNSLQARVLQGFGNTITGYNDSSEGKFQWFTIRR